MYEALVKRLRELPPESFTFEIMGAMHEAADAIEELLDENNAVYAKGWENGERAAESRMPRWIPVTERLPETFKHVLVNIPDMTPHPTVQDAFLEKNGMWYSNGFQYSAEEITHWMPLPAPPAIDTDK